MPRTRACREQKSPTLDSGASLTLVSSQVSWPSILTNLVYLLVLVNQKQLQVVKPYRAKERLRKPRY
eukprot:3294177-Amphidinium_carterae.1